MNKITVVEWVSYSEAEKLKESIGGMGGWFSEGNRWKDYLNNCTEREHPYCEAFREEVVKHEIRGEGDWHQRSEVGVPVFSDGTCASFSLRAWGDIMAAVWAEEENKDYSYMDFYMSMV